MPQYEYQGINASGKSVKGLIITDSSSAAKVQLRRDGVFPSLIREVTGLPSGTRSEAGGGFSFKKKVKTEDRAIMMRQLATLVGSHIPLLEALSALTDQVENPHLKAVIAQVRSDVNEGAALNKACSRFPEVFRPIDVNMIAAGEASGTLDIVLGRLAEFMEFQDRIEKKVKGAMIYPIIMLSMGLGVMLIIFTVLIPQMEQMFADAKKALPLMTQINLAISRFLLSYWWAVLIFAIAVFIGVKRALKTKSGKVWWDKTQLHIPILGEMIRMISISRFTKTLATMLKSGIPLLTSLGVVKNVVTNLTIQRAIEQATNDLTEGANIASPLQRSGQFPPLVTHMIAVGEKTGELEAMLEKVSDYYEYQVNNRIQSLMSILEPVFIIILAVLIGFIVISVITPMFEMNTVAL